MGPRRTSLTALIATAVLVGCGSGAHSSHHHSVRPRTVTDVPSVVPPDGTPQSELGMTIPTPGPTGIPAAREAVAVIRAWSDALRRGDLAGAARYFAIPSVIVFSPEPGGEVLASTIQSRGGALTANKSFPCGAMLLSTDRRGPYINALFRLTDRPGPGGGCGSGTGTTARTNFVITHGLIVKWFRAPDDSRDNGSTAPATPS